MADSFNKKERDKKKRKKKQDKAEKKKQSKLDGVKSEEFLYMDEDGNLVPTKPDPAKKKVYKLEDINVSVPKQSDLDKISSIRIGFVKFYDEDKRFGFIKEEGSNDDYFVHADNLIDKIKENNKVEFELGSGPKGLVAINVKIAKDKPKPVKKEEPADDKVAEGGAKPTPTDAAKPTDSTPDKTGDA